MSRLPIRVVKVGGSLFDLPDLAERIHSWLTDQPPGHHVLVAGGGTLVEQVRDWHHSHPLRDETAHWICVDLMSVMARLLHESLPNIPLLADDRVLCQRIGEQGCTIFDSSHWLRNSESQLPGQTLPLSWDVTSDSIAGRLAVVLAADELVLLKSSLPAQGSDVARLADSGYVDPMLPRLVAELPPIRLFDLRSSGSLIVGRTQDEAQNDRD